MTKVLIVGGGIGGLCLAHGLRADGIEVRVFERTVRRTDWLQGYRIHINPDGAGALRACLPAANWKQFLATVSDGDGGFSFLTPELRPLLELSDDDVNAPDPDPARRHHGVSRIGLREALLAGLDEALEYGREFVRYEVAGGRVVAHFADGGTAEGDLLVGADGANSRVRGQFLPAAERIDTGVIAVAGKHWLTSEAGLPTTLTDRTNVVMPTGPGSLFTSSWSPSDPGAGGGYVLWGYSDAAQHLPVDGLDGAGLRDLIGRRIAGWHPLLRQLVAGSDPETVNAVRVRSAPPRVAPWPTGPVTLLGDAIHSMTPMAGIGANTALRDADLLRRMLAERALPDAVAAYEHRMREYGFAAVRLSLRNARMAAKANPVGRYAFRAVLRTASVLPPLKRRMFADLGSSPND